MDGQVLRSCFANMNDTKVLIAWSDVRLGEAIDAAGYVDSL